MKIRGKHDSRKGLVSSREETHKGRTRTASRNAPLRVEVEGVSLRVPIQAVTKIRRLVDSDLMRPCL